MDLFTPEEIEKIVVIERLHLYNRGLSYEAQAISRVLNHKKIRPLPSVRTINPILKRNCLTHRRTGHYHEDYIGH